MRRSLLRAADGRGGHRTTCAHGLPRGDLECGVTYSNRDGPPSAMRGPPISSPRQSGSRSLDYSNPIRDPAAWLVSSVVSFGHVQPRPRRAEWPSVTRGRMSPDTPDPPSAELESA